MRTLSLTWQQRYMMDQMIDPLSNHFSSALTPWQEVDRFRHSFKITLTVLAQIAFQIPLGYLLLLNMRDKGSTDLLSAIILNVQVIICVVTTLAYTFSAIFLYRSANKQDFCQSVCMSTYIFYLYMHLYPMCNVLLPALIYSVVVALSAFSNFSFFTERLHFFFNLLENNLGEFYLHGILRNLK